MVELELFGTVDPGTYRLELDAQPMVNADQVLVDLTPAEGWTIVAASAGDRGGFAAEGGGERAVLAGTLSSDFDLRARFREQ